MKIDLAKVRSYWRFILFILLIGIIGIVIFWIRLMVFQGMALPDLSQTSGREDFAAYVQFIFMLIFVPIMVFLGLIGYPTWRLLVTQLHRLPIRPWMCLAGGAIMMAFLSILPFILIVSLGGSASNIADSADLFVFIFGVVFSAALTASFALYREKKP